MKTFHAETKNSWGEKSALDVAAKTFLEAWEKVKRIMKRRKRTYRILSLVETAVLDG